MIPNQLGIEMETLCQGELKIAPTTPYFTWGILVDRMLIQLATLKVSQRKHLFSTLFPFHTHVALYFRQLFRKYFRLTVGVTRGAVF